MTRDEILGLIVFAVRCTAAGTIAYLLADAVGLLHPLWACIFALIVTSQEAASDLKSIGGKLIGTVIGCMVAVAVSAVMNRYGVGIVWNIAAAVAICSVFVWRHPAIQLCLWTPPIVLMSALPSESIASVAYSRGCEVSLGILVGGLLHIADEKFVTWRRRGN